MMDLFPYGTIVAGNFYNFKLVMMIVCCLIYRVGVLACGPRGLVNGYNRVLYRAESLMNCGQKLTAVIFYLSIR